MEPSNEAVKVKKEPSSHSSHHNSHHSSHRSRSSSSSTSKRAKVEAARALLKLAEEEAALRKKLSQLEEQDEIDQATIKASAARRRADYQADMDLLAAKKTAAALDAEAKVLEQDSSLTDRDLSEYDIASVKEDPQTRTTEYVSNLCRHLQTNGDKSYTDTDIPPNANLPHRTESPASSYVGLPRTVHTFQSPNHVQNAQLVPDISKFLLRKELLISRLYRFSDKPESYFVWKSSFQNILADLQVTEFEQLDLLVKWLGPESSSYALSIRAANADNPARALRLLWERLDERYGSPERIESVLKDKLSKFSKISLKDSLKLYELSDLLTEISSLKEQPMYQPLLAYFDSSVGVNPIIEKLPHHMKEKWITRASKYKETNGQCFPPFKFFVSFVKEMSTMKNDPSFLFGESVHQVTKPTRPPAFLPKPRFPVTTTKTDILPDLREKITMCQIHGTNHRLSECRAFQNKSLEARKNFLKEKGLCFKCCDFAHKSRHCKEKLKCTICDSDKHATVMHGDIPPKAHGGESTVRSGTSTNTHRTSLETLTVESSCTEICGKITLGKSCQNLTCVCTSQRTSRKPH